MQRLEHLQIPERNRVQNQKIARLIVREPPQMLDVPPQARGQIMHNGACRPHARRLPLQPEPVQRRHLEMIPQRELRRLRRENPVLHRNRQARTPFQNRLDPA